MNKSRILFGLLFLLLIGVIGYIVYGKYTPVVPVGSPASSPTSSLPPVSSGEGAKTSPPVEGMETWKTYESYELSFRYPDELGMNYIHPTAWPPIVEKNTDPYSCVVGGSEESRDGVTEKITLYGQEYCRTIATGAAAGSVYKDYTYNTKQDDKNVSLSFTLQEPQCANYNDSERSDCEAEHTYFDVDSVVVQILSTLVFQ